MNRHIRQLVRERAKNRCEYCGLSQDLSPVAQLQIEHIVPRKHGGSDDEQNLESACIDCNLAKGSNLTGIDPTTEAIVQLFNPRIQNWDEHFVWRDMLLVGKTSIGRATIRVLNINDDERQRVRVAASG